MNMALKKVAHLENILGNSSKLLESFSIALGGNEWIKIDRADIAINTNSFGRNIVSLSKTQGKFT